MKLFLPIFKMNFPEIVDIALPAASASINTRGVICQEIPQRSLHQPQWLS